MKFDLVFTKSDVANDPDPNVAATAPKEGPGGRVLNLPKSFDHQGAFPTGSISAYFEVLNATPAVTVDGTLTAQLWIQDLLTRTWIKVGAAQAAVAANTAGRAMVEFKTSGFNAPCNAYIQLTTVAGTAAASVKGFCAATGIRA